MPKKLNRYQAIIQEVFFDHYTKGTTEFDFLREELDQAAANLDIAAVKNLGDVPYSFRYRRKLPDSILDTQPAKREWVILGAGKGRYRFKLFKEARIVPRDGLVVTDIPDATPELIRKYALDDEQALLAIVRYNRLIDTFLGLTTFSLQNHLRTTVQGIGQIEVDELYIGLDKHGCHHIVPVQAKVGRDRIGVVQIVQDIGFVEQKFSGMRCRAIAAQFMRQKAIALFELILQDDEIRIVDERHYRLVPADNLDDAAIRNYRT